MCARVRLCIVLISLFIAGVTGASAGIINVPADQPTIQAGIDAAVFGDEVVIAPGTYHERITFKGKGITVRSTGPTNPTVVAATVINGDAGGPVVLFNSAEGELSVLTGLTITNGSGYDSGWGIVGGGVACWYTSPKILRCVITGNNAVMGGGVYTTYGSPLIKDNKIIGNTGTSGGGICLSWCTATVTGNLITGNGAQNGAGILNWSGPVTIANNLISANSATFGGGIYSRGGETVVTRNTLVRNTAGVGGGIYRGGIGELVVSNSILVFSPAGGGVFLEEAATTPTIRYCNVFANTPRNYSGMPGQAGTNGNICADPLFVNKNGSPLNPTNFRLQSQGGYWNGAIWLIGALNSLCIDAGDPASNFANEPAPNGGRVNMGFDGNTAYASKTPGQSPVVISASPQHVGAPNTAPFSAQFSMDMHRVSVESNLVVSPAMTGDLGWSGSKRVIFTPTSPWIPGRWYTVTIKRAARSTTGVKMAADFVWSFKTVAPAAPALVTATASPTAAGAQITVSLSATASVRVRILNMAGREVAVLPEQSLEAGTQTLLWNGRSAAGTIAPAGQYLISVTARQEGGGRSEVLAPLRK